MRKMLNQDRVIGIHIAPTGPIVIGTQIRLDQGFSISFGVLLMALVGLAAKADIHLRPNFPLDFGIF